jgi:hypothetical protein
MTMQTTETASAASAASAGSEPRWMSVSDAARELGVNKSTVSRQVSTLGVVKNETGKLIDYNDLVAKRGSDLQPQMARTGQTADAYQSGDLGGFGAAPSATSMPVGTTKRGGLTAASTALKVIQAQTAKLDLEERQNKIAQRSEIRELGQTATRTLRDELLGISPRIRHQLASMTDPAEIGAKLDAEITAALNNLVAQLERLGSEDQRVS